MADLGYENGSRGRDLHRARAWGSSLMPQQVAQTEAASSHPDQNYWDDDRATHHEDFPRPRPPDYDGLVQRLFDVSNGGVPGVRLRSIVADREGADRACVNVPRLPH